MKKRKYAACSALLLTHLALPAGAETLDTLAEFGNSATANAASDAGIARGADFANAAAGSYSITAGGTDFWGNSDNGSFIYDADQSRAADENFSVIVRSVSIAGDPAETLAGEWGRTGVMARKTPDAANSACVAHIRKSGGNTAGTNPPDTLIQGRDSDGAGTNRGPGENGEHRNFVENTANGSVRNTPIWLALHRYQGEWYSTWAVDNGGVPGEWSAAIQRAGTPDMAGEVYVGLAHQSHNINPIVNTAVFESFEVSDFNRDLGAFPLDVTCGLTLSGDGVTVTASGIELSGDAPEDVNWEVRYVGDGVTINGKLNADIYLQGNGGSIAAFDTMVAAGPPAGSTQIEQIHWAAGSYTTTNAAGTNLFAQAVPGQFGGDQNSYAVNMTGEIHIPSDADRGGLESILFHDGVDDFVYLEIDGVVLIDNNQWSNVAGTGNNGGTQTTLDVSDPKFDDGEWVSFRMATWEGNGGDDAILVWNALDTTGADSVTGGTDAVLNSYGGTGLGNAPQVSFAHDFSDKIPAANFRAPQPALLNTESGFGQPDGEVIDPPPVGTLALELYVNGVLCESVSARPSVVSADFTNSTVLEMVIRDAGEGGVADVEPASLVITLDGDAISPAVSKVGGLTTLTYTFPAAPTQWTSYSLAASGTTTTGTGNLPFAFTASATSFPILDELRAGLPAPPNATEGWDYMEFSAATTLGGNLGAGQQGFIDAQTVISTAAAPTAQANQPYINHIDPDNAGTTGDWNPDLPILTDVEFVDDNQYVTYARTTVTIGAGEEGDYTFRVNGDDGFGLRVAGASFTSLAGAAVNRLDARDPSVVFRPDYGGNAPATAVCNFPAPGDYLVEFFGFEGGGGSFQEISWAPGSFTSILQSADWALLGDTSGFVPESPLAAISEAALPPAPTSEEPGWSTYLYYNATVGTLANTLDYINNTADPNTAVAVTLPALNHSDDGGNAGRVNPTEAFPGDPIPGGGTDNIGMISRAFIVAPADGDYTIQVRSDDGFLLRWANPSNTFGVGDGGGAISLAARNAAYFPNGTGDSNTRVSVNLTAGIHELIFVWWEGGGGSHFEITAAPGIELNQSGPFELLSTTPSDTNLYVGSAGSGELVISDISYSADEDNYSLTFDTVTGVNYAIKADTDLFGFETLVTDTIVGTGSPQTVGPFLSPFPGAPKVFFRLEVIQNR